MRRPADWSPLDRASDPVPGDPEAVDDQARAYRKTADEIEQQARMLRALSRADGWESEAGEVFAEEAGELAGKLAKAHGRYVAVATQLCRWAPALREAQREADAALDKARDALAAKGANATPLLTGVADPTPEQEAAERKRVAAYDAAAGAVGAAKDALQDALDALDDVAGRVAGAIRDASDDDVKDGFWDKVKGVVSDYAGIINVIAEVASWLALGIAVVAIVIGAGIPLLVVGLLTGAALLLKMALAASGEGSWLDVIVEGVSLATLGIGKVLAKSAKLGVALTRGAAARHAAGEAATAVLRKNRFTLAGANFVKRVRVPLGPLRRLATAHTGRVAARAERAGSEAAQAVRRTPLARAALRTRFRQLDTDMANYADDVAGMARRYGTSPEVAANVRRTQEVIKQARVVAGTGYGVDISDKAGVFDPVKPYFTWEFRPMRW